MSGSILGEPKKAPLGDRRYKSNRRAPAPAPTCETCGGPRSIYSARQCRGCYQAALRTRSSCPSVKQIICEDCGKPCSAYAQRCRACVSAKVRHQPSVCVDCGGPCSYLSQRCRSCYMAKAEARRLPRNAKEAWTVSGVKPIASAPPAPPLPAPRPPVRVEREQEGARHPIIERHALALRDREPENPLANIRERKPPPAPDFPPEFLAKLKRVAEGAGIVEVRPITRRGDVPGGGSSLGFDG